MSLEQMILAAVAEIFRDQNFSRFRTWARETIPELLSLDDEQLTPAERARLGALLGIAVWNVTPLPQYGYHPQPVTLPTSHQPCLCGSGRRFADCCANHGDLPVMPPDLIWDLIVDDLPEDAIQTALHHHAIPDHLLARVATRWLEANHPGRAAALLEPLFSGALDQLDEQLESALDVLCDAYDELDYSKKKHQFLLRVTQDGSRILKAAAWQRLSTISIDTGEFSRAHAAFEQALRHAPNNPANALLEITLLAAQHHNDLARERARFWQHKFRRIPLVASERVMTFLTHAIRDPQGALAATHAGAMDPVLLALRDWLVEVIERPLPEYTVELHNPPAPLFTATDQDIPLSLFQTAPLPLSNPTAASMVLRPPPAIVQIEQQWVKQFAASKPHALHLRPLKDNDVWEHAHWIQFLIHHPAAIDSLDILDDLATIIYDHPEGGLPWLMQTLLRPVCERAVAMMTFCLAANPAMQLAWAIETNRPALRLLFRLYLIYAEEGRDDHAILLLERLLQLNPHDQHGVRAELMNHYLRHHQNAKAIVLAQQFPQDSLAELVYGEVLALYRLGEHDQAAAVLTNAIERLPRIPHFLLRKRIKRPLPNPSGFTPGSDDQAWLYREAMRDVWVAEPGLLAWMKKLTA
ncbi:SEC-C domain-containing protein [Rhodopseudomonas palustris]|uniref:SEC-C domain-containing protein n=1 Tax=Thiospirillum jenense TaxID=1653858 RepID=A0A839HE36_9GAMM|nr:SEC-C metal-binding domain-containing protein [Thiospirillum jenense]MBB1093070.1 SEC-C domain-containing protein [Rhodopseudomonas palustris]MBB1127143.1 SEC-C domain-containing protein [Thiospirillum jenense]